LPTLGEAIGSGPGQPDYKALYEQSEARRQGLDRKVNEMTQARQVLDGEFATLKQQVGEILSKLAAPQAPAPEGGGKTPQAPAPAPVSDGNAQGQSLDPLTVALEQKRAEQYRDMLLEEYTKPGAKGHGLPLNLFADRIKVIKPSINPDNTVNDQAQRAEIEAVIEKLATLKGQAQDEAQTRLLEGTGPGSALPPGAPGGAQGVYQEFLKAMEAMGSKAFDELPLNEQTEIEATYFRLLNDPDVQRQHGGQLQPTPSVNDMYDQIRELTRRMDNFKMPATMG